MIIVRPFGETSDLPEETLKLVQSIASTTEADVRRLLPILPAEIMLHVGHDAQVIPETGEVGRSVALGHVTWLVDISRETDPAVAVRKELRHTLFHELHHQARGVFLRGGSVRRAFIEAPIAEGLATAFERDESGRNPPWGNYPGKEETTAWVHELLALPVTADYRQWMFLHADGRRWIGYKAGTFIVDLATDSSGRSATDLVSTPAAEILLLAGFE